MPMYTWHCKKCDHRFDILRDYDLYRDEPKTEDPDYKECKKGEEHEWEKELGQFTVSRPPGYGKKGHWIQLFGIIGVLECMKYLDMFL